MHDHRRQRQPLLASLRTRLGDFVETPEQALEVIGYELAVIPRQVVHALIDRAERTGPTLVVEIAAETLVSPARAHANEIRQLLLLVFESCGHGISLSARCVCTAHLA